MLSALLCVQRTMHTSSPQTIDWYADEKEVIIEGHIADEPDRRPLQTKYTIETEALTTASGQRITNISGKVLVTDHRQWPPYAYGDRVEATGILELPGDIDGFRYDHYLSRYGIYGVIYRGSLKQVPNNYPQTTMQTLRKNLYSLKENFEFQINTLYPEPHASFMAGLLTGSRKGIPDTLMQAFNTTGLTHIIAISGYNITIVIAVISSLLFWIPHRIRSIPAIIAIIAFTLFVGASAAVTRAAIMGILGLIALQCGRSTHIRLSILWTAFFMIAWNPKVLWYDAGFQLSFLAVLGLVELSPLLEKYCSKIPETLAMRESLQMTIAAQIAAAPLIVLLFGRLSLIAPIANLLVAPLLPVAMLFGAISTTISFVDGTIGQLLAYIGWACLEWIIFIANICSVIPLASISLIITPWMLVSYYGILLGITIHTKAPSSAPATTEQA